MKYKLLLITILFLAILQPAKAQGYMQGVSENVYQSTKIEALKTTTYIVATCPVHPHTPAWFHAKLNQHTKDCRKTYLLSAIAFYESRFNSKAKNAKSTASGIYQYLASTWLSHKCGNLDSRYNVDSSIICALKDLDRGLGKQWAVWRSVNNNKYGYRL